MRRRLREEEGQIFPALLLVVVVLLFGALAIGQLGSASDERGQARTAADAAAVAAAQQLLARAVVVSPPGLPPGLAGRIDMGGSYSLPDAAGCAAARRNWEANHDSSLACGPGDYDFGSASIRVRLTSPAGEIVDGPAADTSGTRSRAQATAAVRFVRCPDGYGPLADRILGAWTDSAAQRLGLGDPGCGPSWSVLDTELNPVVELVDETLASAAPLPSPPPPPDLSGLPSRNAAFEAIVRSFRVEIVE